MSKLALRSFRLKNFKAVRDSGAIRFTPLTVFIGNNGSGKSSVIEGMETLQAIVGEGLDEAMQRWHGFEYIWYQGARHQLRTGRDGRAYHENPIRFEFRGHGERGRYHSAIQVNLGAGGNELILQNERSYAHAPGIKSDLRFSGTSGREAVIIGRSDPDFPKQEVLAWQFLSLAPENMGEPTPQKRTPGPPRLAKDGRNIAEYLNSIRALDGAAFEGIVETLQAILPYARDVQPVITSELERAVYLQMTEGGFKVPGWLLSTGTLRLLALLAVLRHPSPPPVVVVEEIENGLDPRTLGLLVDEIRAAVDGGRMQVIATTHSPYLLDLLTLEHLVLVERVEGTPVFSRPADREALQEWARKFGPGRLYTMGRLEQEACE